jgi:hypothetical protein
MATKKDQHKTGIPAKPRGQQTGFAGNPDQNREEMERSTGRTRIEPQIFTDFIHGFLF